MIAKCLLVEADLSYSSFCVAVANYINAYGKEPEILYVSSFDNDWIYAGNVLKLFGEGKIAGIKIVIRQDYKYDQWSVGHEGLDGYGSTSS